MLTSHQIFEELERVTHVTELQRGARVQITGAAQDADARSGDIAWISKKGFAADPVRIQTYRGSVLIVPDEIPVSEIDDAVTVLCSPKPKLAFSKAVSLALPHLLGEGWPKAGQTSSDINVTVSPTASLAPGVVIGSGVVIESGAEIGPNTCLAHTTVEEGATIGANCSIGLSGFGFERDTDGSLLVFPHIGRVRLGPNVSIGSNTCIDRGSLGETVIGAGTKVDNLVHIAHNVRVGADSLVIAHAMVGGSVEIGDRVWVAPNAAIMNQVALGSDSIVGLGAVVLRSVDSGQTVVGNPARPLLRK